VSLVTMVILLPVVIYVAIRVRLSSNGPIMFLQERIGINGKPFFIYKFRSMRTDAEDQGPQLSHDHDNRVTPWGKVMRKWRLDEIPQFFNVLKGSMSIIGPRPERPEFVGKLSKEMPFYETRHIVKPGLTGWAQLKYPYGSTEKDSLEKLKYDLYYIKHRSFLLDLLILIRTVEIVLFGKGR